MTAFELLKKLNSTTDHSEAKRLIRLIKKAGEKVLYDSYIKEYILVW